MNGMENGGILLQTKNTKMSEVQEVRQLTNPTSITAKPELISMSTKTRITSPNN